MRTAAAQPAAVFFVVLSSYLASTCRGRVSREGSDMPNVEFHDDDHPKDNETLLTTLCQDRCATDCVSYKTPLSSCYNGQQLFPGDPSWGDYDIQDDVQSSLQLVRRGWYASQNGTCLGRPTDQMTLPLHGCIGPFGKPRPWGILELIQNISMDQALGRI